VVNETGPSLPILLGIFFRSNLTTKVPAAALISACFPAGLVNDVVTASSAPAMFPPMAAVTAAGPPIAPKIANPPAVETTGISIHFL